MVFNVNAAAVETSAATESAVGAEVGTAALAAAPALTGVLPMGADADSVAFAAALNAAGASYVGTAAEHLANRELFAGSQSLAAATYAAADAINDATLSL